MAVEPESDAKASVRLDQSAIWLAAGICP